MIDYIIHEHSGGSAFIGLLCRILFSFDNCHSVVKLFHSVIKPFSILHSLSEESEVTEIYESMSAFGDRSARSVICQQTVDHNTTL